MSEKTQFGILPKIAPDGLRPLDAYAETVSEIRRERIALVVGGLGLSQTGTQKAIEQLPPQVTLAFSPFGHSLDRWMRLAREKGHEIALQIPLEPLGYPAVDPGNGTLLAQMSADEKLAALRYFMARTTNYPTIIGYLGGGFLDREENLEPVLRELKARGLAWLDDGTVASSRSLDLARRMRLAHGRADILIDGARDRTRTAANLALLEARSRRFGSAIGTASAFPESVKSVNDWLVSLENSDIQIVPLSRLLRDYGK